MVRTAVTTTSTATTTTTTTAATKAAAATGIMPWVPDQLAGKKSQECAQRTGKDLKMGGADRR